MTGTPIPEDVSTKLLRIAALAAEDPQRSFLTLAHYIDIAFLREAFKRTRKDGATGVDRQTAQEYAQNLEENLQSLLNRFKSGSYRAPPVRRVHIPKGDGSKTRPIGIPTFEDKVLQRAVAMVLGAIYEVDFLDCSYGFRPGRSQHQALRALDGGLMSMNGGWVLEVDVKGYFDTIDHGCLRTILDQRVRDGVLRRTIDKWLKAGVFENGQLYRPGTGTPQGGVISPILSNIYLHAVLDVWFENEVKPILRGQAFAVRFADDFVLVFSRQEDAQRVHALLEERFRQHGLTIHPEKTRLLRFQRPMWRSEGKGHYADGQCPATFDFLGFTFHWGRSRKGKWVIRQRTAKDRFSRALVALDDWCRRARHRPVVEQHKALVQKLRGHYQYYGVTGNWRRLANFRYQVMGIWRKWLNRRSQRGGMTWERFYRLERRLPLPHPHIAHSAYRRAANA